MIIILGQGTHMVLLEVVSTHSPVALLTEGLALCFAAFKGTFLAELPGILERHVQQPGDNGLIPLLVAAPDAQVVIILVESLDTTHTRIVLPDNVRLWHINILLGFPGVFSGAGGNGLCPQNVAHHGHRSVVLPSDQRYIYLKYQPMPFA